MKKVIVTGGYGFIGSNLINLLIKKKYYVINIDNCSYSSNNYNLNDNVKYFPYFHEYYDLISYNKPFTNHDKLTFYIYKRKN